MIQYIISLLLTIVIEGIVALAWGIRGKDLLLVTLVNVLTNPLVVLVHNYAPGILLNTLVPEVAAVIVEGGIFIWKENDIKKPLVFAVVANVVSFTCGLVISALL